MVAAKTVIIFTKFPIPGQVKTRLTENSDLSPEDASILAEAMLKDTILLAQQASPDIIGVGYWPPNALDQFKNLIFILQDQNPALKSIIFEYWPQSGTNFDSRFGSVVQQAKGQKCSPIVILGADLPYMPPSCIETAFRLLKTDDKFPFRKDIVVGPASGGGIYLVGVNSTFDATWFDKYQIFRGNIEIKQFIKFCESQQFVLHLLPPMADVDLEEDLVTLLLYIDAIKASQSHIGFQYPEYTANAISNLGLVVENATDVTRRRKIRKTAYDPTRN